LHIVAATIVRIEYMVPLLLQLIAEIAEIDAAIGDGVY